MKPHPRRYGQTKLPRRHGALRGQQMGLALSKIWQRYGSDEACRETGLEAGLAGRTYRMLRSSRTMGSGAFGSGVGRARPHVAFPPTVGKPSYPAATQQAPKPPAHRPHRPPTAAHRSSCAPWLCARPLPRPGSASPCCSGCAQGFKT